MTPPKPEFLAAYLYQLLKQNQSLFQEIISYDSQTQTITLHLDSPIYFKKESHGNQDIYRIEDSNHQTLSWNDIGRIRGVVEERLTRERNQSQEERNSTTRERNQLAENNRRALGLYLQRIPEAQRQEVLNSFESYITQEIELSTKISILNKLQEAHRKAGFLPHDFNFSNSQTNKQGKET